MKKLLLALLLFCSPAFADGLIVPPSQVGVAPVGQIPGTATNDNAAVGKVGEYIAASTAGPGAANTVTVTIASPAVVTFPSFPYLNTIGNSTVPIVFTTTGALPTGITSGTQYWIIGSSISGNTFNIATSIANALAGTAINTSGTQSGVHTGTPGISTASATAVSFAAINLTAGDWDIRVVAGYAGNGSTNVTTSTASLSNTLDTLNTMPGSFSEVIKTGVVPAAGAGDVIPLSTNRISLAAPATYYATALSIFTAGTQSAYGVISARRVR